MEKSVADIFEEYAQTGEQGSSSIENVSEEGLSKVSLIAHQARKKESEIEDTEKLLKKLKSEHHKIVTENLPDIMAELNMTGITLNDGSSISVIPTVGCHISQTNKEQAHSWLRDNGYGDIIKSDVSVSFRKGEDGKRADFIELAEAQGQSITTKESVHPSTLKAWVKEEVIQQGKEVPVDLFGVYSGQKAVISKNKRG